MPHKLLVVEDDPNILLGLEHALESDGYEVETCSDGKQAIETLLAGPFDLVVLDIMLPGKSGFDICRELRSRKNQIPILMLTAKGQEVDKVVGLELGADDYVTKPFSLRELSARIRALLRRSDLAAGPSPSKKDWIRFGTVEIHTPSLRGADGKRKFELSPRELSVLTILYREQGNAVSRDQLLNEVWGIDYYGTTRTLDQVIVKLRQKIESTPGHPRHIMTIHGHGYRLENGSP